MPWNRCALIYLTCAIVPFAVVGCGHARYSGQGANALTPQNTTVQSTSSTGAQAASSTTKAHSASAGDKRSNTSTTKSTNAAGGSSGSSHLGSIASVSAASSSNNGSSGVSASNTTPTSTVTMHADGVKVRFRPDAWRGLGTAALIVSPSNQTNYTTQLLYVITDGAGVKASGTRPTLSLLSNHATAAKISPTGQYVAVLTTSSSGASAASPVQDTLWLMAADGSSKQKLSTDVYSLVGSWLPHTDTFIYADTKGSVYSVTPGLPPTKLAIHLGKGQTIQAIEPNPQNSKLALDVVVPDSSGDPTKRHDEIVTWDLNTKQMKTLATAKQSNGYLLGPWTNDGQKLFYWLDPQHSGSIAADGLPLFEVDARSSKAVSVADTLTGQTVLPVAGEQAVIQSGNSRFLYDKKTIQMWSQGHVSTLTQRGKAPDITQFEPNLSPDGTTVSFVEGPVLQNQDMAGQSMYDWWNSLQIVTANLQTGTEHLLSIAGHGVSSPHYGPGGERMIFLKGSQLDVTASNNTGNVTPIFSVDSSTQSYGGQWGFTVPLDITDYVR